MCKNFKMKAERTCGRASAPVIHTRNDSISKMDKFYPSNPIQIIKRHGDLNQVTVEISNVF